MKSLLIAALLLCSLSALVAQDDGQPIDFKKVLSDARHRDSLEKEKLRPPMEWTLPQVEPRTSIMFYEPRGDLAHRYMRISLAEQYEFYTEEGDVFRISSDGVLTINNQQVATDKRLVGLAEYIARHFKSD